MSHAANRCARRPQWILSHWLWWLLGGRQRELMRKGCVGCKPRITTLRSRDAFAPIAPLHGSPNDMGTMRAHAEHVRQMTTGSAASTAPVKRSWRCAWGRIILYKTRGCNLAEVVHRSFARRRVPLRPCTSA